MPADLRIAVFLDQALAAGLPHSSIVGILTARGWSEKEVYAALADQYQRSTGNEIPSRTGSGASAKEAFFYLLIFSTLATWTIGFGCLAFALIDRWLADPLFSRFQQNLDRYTITYSLAALIVAFPLYLLISRIVVKESAAHPEKLDSSVRKWLTYMALVIAASVFMGDLIAALAYLLRGELTSRFLAKSLVVLALSGGVFYYYFGGLRKTDVGPDPPRFRRDTFMAALSSVLVMALVILGFSQSGPPKTQRDFRADSKRVQDLYILSGNINLYWTDYSKLPPGLDHLPGNVNYSYLDPVTFRPYITTPDRAPTTSSAPTSLGHPNRTTTSRVKEPGFILQAVTAFPWRPQCQWRVLRPICSINPACTDSLTFGGGPYLSLLTNAVAAPRSL